eukprot:5603784-Amphidinium_carterae.1
MPMIITMPMIILMPSASRAMALTRHPTPRRNCDNERRPVKRGGPPSPEGQRPGHRTRTNKRRP